jgi:hypothetical protein
MPGVNRICNTIMSPDACNFELLLRRDAAPRNIRNRPAKKHRLCAGMGK